MSNESFAILTPLVVLIVMIAAGRFFYWDIVRRHPVNSTKTHRVDSSGAATTVHAETFENDELNQRIAIRLQENAVSTERIVREANQLASSIERLAKAVTGAK